MDIDSGADRAIWDGYLSTLYLSRSPEVYLYEQNARSASTPFCSAAHIPYDDYHWQRFGPSVKEIPVPISMFQTGTIIKMIACLAVQEPESGFLTRVYFDIPDMPSRFPLYLFSETNIPLLSERPH